MQLYLFDGGGLMCKINLLPKSLLVVAVAAVLITVTLAGSSTFVKSLNAYAIPFSNLKASSAGSAVFPQSNSVLAGLGDRWWNYAFSIDTSNPNVINPFTDATGASCSGNNLVGLQPDNILFLFGTAGEITTTKGTGGHTGDVRTCSIPIPRGTSIFLPVLNTECSVAEGNGFTEQDLRNACTTITNHAVLSSLEAIVDGKQLLSSFGQVQQSHAVTGPGGFQLTIVPNNPFGVTKVITDPNLPARPLQQPITTLSVADGFWVLLSNLQPGPHTIKFGGVYNFNQPNNPPDLGFVFRTEVTYNLQVK
jgi:hypothetical protein